MFAQHCNITGLWCVICGTIGVKQLFKQTHKFLMISENQQLLLAASGNWTQHHNTLNINKDKKSTLFTKGHVFVPKGRERRKVPKQNSDVIDLQEISFPVRRLPPAALKNMQVGLCCSDCCTFTWKCHIGKASRLFKDGSQLSVLNTEEFEIISLVAKPPWDQVWPLTPN